MKIEKGEKLVINTKYGQVVMMIDENNDVQIYADKKIISYASKINKS